MACMLNASKFTAWAPCAHGGHWYLKLPRAHEGLTQHTHDPAGTFQSRVQEKEQGLMAISENARRHIERSRADRGRTYDTLLKQYR